MNVSSCNTSTIITGIIKSDKMQKIPNKLPSKTLMYEKQEKMCIMMNVICVKLQE